MGGGCTASAGVHTRKAAPAKGPSLTAGPTQREEVRLQQEDEERGQTKSVGAGRAAEKLRTGLWQNCRLDAIRGQI